MAMQPSPMAETFKPEVPSVRVSMAAAPLVLNRGSSGAVLLVADVLAPRDGAARLVVLLHGDVGHEAVGGGAVPVVLTGLEEDPVARPELIDRPALALAEPDALGDEDRLTVGMCVPCGARSGREVHERRGEGRGAGWRRDRVDV